jgi:mycothiol synthase
MHRSYQGEDDYKQMRSMLSQGNALSGIPSYLTPGDLDWWRVLNHGNTELENVRLWFDESDQLLGFNWFNPREFNILVHPDHAQLVDDMISWSEDWLLAKAPDDEKPSTLRMWSLTSDLERIKILKKRCYSIDAEHWLTQRFFDLKQPINDAILPPGYAIRCLRGEEEFPTRVEVHRDAFAPSRMTLEKYSQLPSLPSYCFENDLVTTAPDGSFAAFCITWFDANSGLGVFEPVGCAQAHQRKGLTRALMLAGCLHLRELGAHTAIVDAWSGEVASNKLYESAGFREIDRFHPWKKVLEQ